MPESGPPDWLFNEQGKIATFMPAFDTTGGKCHFLCPSGIGDVAWIFARTLALKDFGIPVKYWFPNDIYKRVGPYAEMMGADFGYTNIDIRELLSYPGEFPEGAFDNGGIFYIHANRHIEEGNPLHDNCPKYGKPMIRTWMPWLPFKNPAPPVNIVAAGHRPCHTGAEEGVWAYEKKPKTYLIVHMASPTYCEGNHFPRQWARMLEWIEGEIAPVKLIGAKWDEPMIEKVCEFYEPSQPACIGQSLSTALSAIANSSGMIGVDSGLTIMGTYFGLPCLRAYPRWLYLMPGTWEDKETLHPHNKAIFMDELLESYKEWCLDLKKYL